MMRHTFMAVAVALMLPLAAHAQNREHLQMTADLQILQEQINRLQLAANRLDEQLQATSKRIDDVSAAGVKGFADQQLLINQLAGTLTTLRERLDDNTVRVTQLTQEFSAVREGVRLLTEQLNTLVGLLAPATTGAEGAPAAGNTGAAPPAAAATTGAPASNGAGLNRVVLPASAGRIYQQAMGDYMSQRYDIAIEGFREVIEKFPDAPDAANAQFQVGESYYQKRSCKEAIPAYQGVLKMYASSDRVPEAYYMLGVCYTDLNQRTDAQQMFQQVVKQYPDSIQAIQARQRLQAMGLKP